MSLIPAGKYPGRAREWRLAETKGGAAQVAADMEFTEGDLKGQSLLWFGHFTDAALPITLKALRAMGWKGNDVLELDTPQADLNANEVELVVVHEEWDGVVRAKIAFVNKKGGVDVTTPLAADKRADFAKRMRVAIAATEQGQGPKTNGQKPAAARTPPPPMTDDIPF